MNQPRQSSSDVTREAFNDIQVDGVPVRAGFRAETQDVVAGGPLEVSFVVANSGTAPVYLTVSADRSRLRADLFAFSAGLDGSDSQLSDPLADAVYLGGPSTVVSVQPNSSYIQTVLLNQYLTLEEIPHALAASGSDAGMLWLHCQRQLSISTAQDRVRTVTPVSVDETLRLPVRTDQAALDGLAASLADQVRSDTQPTGAGNREALVTKLIALRSDTARAQLETLRDHPDPTVQALVRGALDQPH